MTDIPTGFRTDPPPQDGSQFVAWAHDQNALGFDKEHPDAQWVIAQWAAEYRGGTPYWRWATPGRSTSVRILAWMPLPHLDRYGKYGLDNLQYRRDENVLTVMEKE